MQRKSGVVAVLILCLWSLGGAAVEETKTKYPIVLIHGFLGFGDGMSWLVRYFGDIPEILRYHGATVYIADVSQANTIESRGEDLREQLQAWGHQRYNLIGHSHGGLDSRYVLETYPDLVASVTTIGSPHHGSKVADYLHDTMTRNRWARLFLLTLGEALGHTIGLLSGTFYAQDIERALVGLTTDGIASFNQEYSIGLGDHYCSDGAHEYYGRRLYSWGTSTIPGRLYHDLVGRLLRWTGSVFWDDEENDGLVARCSMKFGKWLGAHDGHHLVPVGGVLGTLTHEQREWAQTMFYDHAVRLKTAGL